jgi:hypothetical protein
VLHLLNLLAAIALLVWGTHIVRTGMMRLLGENLRRVLAESFSQRGHALLAGIGVTGLVQSSTATCLMLASFASQGLVGGAAALAVMLGADIGTALMVAVYSFDLSWVSPLLIFVALWARQGTALIAALLIGVLLDLIHTWPTERGVDIVILGPWAFGCMLAAYTNDAITLAKLLYQLDPELTLVGPLYALGDDFALDHGAHAVRGVLEGVAVVEREVAPKARVVVQHFLAQAAIGEVQQHLAARAMVEQPARRRNQHVDAAVELLVLIAEGNAADEKRHREFVVLAIGLEILGHLRREFARRFENERPGHTRPRPAA